MLKKIKDFMKILVFSFDFLELLYLQIVMQKYRDWQFRTLLKFLNSYKIPNTTGIQVHILNIFLPLDSCLYFKDMQYRILAKCSICSEKITDQIQDICYKINS